MSVPCSSRDVRVLGLGNVLMGDDALGPWVVEELLATWEFPQGVCVLDVGTPGLDLTPYLADAETVILVDTVRADGAPGTLRVYSRAELFSRPPQPRTSPHDPGLTEALLALTFAGSAPRDVLLVGVVPGAIGSGIGLSPGMREAVERAAVEVVERLAALGLPPIPRAPRLPASPWWEQPVDRQSMIGDQRARLSRLPRSRPITR